MTYNNSLKYIMSLSDASGGGTERIRAILSALESPQRQLRSIHICGDAGKNSSAEMLSSILLEGGFSVGIYSLAYAGDIRERIKAGGKIIPHAEFAEAVKKIADITGPDALNIPLSKEEALFLIALLYFEKEGCELAVFERDISSNDSTVLAPPLLSVITSFFDNTPLSFENIIHRGTRETVTCIQHKDTYTAISDACASVGSRLTLPIYGEVEVKKISLFKTFFSYRNTEYSIPTFSPCQILNAITVIEAAHALCRVGVNISSEAISRGLSKAHLSLKCEVVSVEPTIIVASATNGKQIEALAASLAQVKEHLPSKISVFSPPSSDRLVRDISQRLLSCEIETSAVTLIEDSSSSLFKHRIKDIITPVMRVEKSNDALLFIGEREYVFELVTQIRKNLGNM